MTTESSNIFRVTRGYTTSLGDGFTEYVLLFKSLEEALQAARGEVGTLRVTKREGYTISEDVIVEQLDQDGEPVGQPVFWVKADMGVIA